MGILALFAIHANPHIVVQLPLMPYDSKRKMMKSNVRMQKEAIISNSSHIVDYT
jgi:hypothetical protein